MYEIPLAIKNYQHVMMSNFEVIAHKHYI